MSNKNNFIENIHNQYYNDIEDTIYIDYINKSLSRDEIEDYIEILNSSLIELDESIAKDTDRLIDEFKKDLKEFLSKEHDRTHDSICHKFPSMAIIDIIIDVCWDHRNQDDQEFKDVLEKTILVFDLYERIQGYK